MATPTATFLPYVRAGLANLVAPAPVGTLRTTVNVEFELKITPPTGAASIRPINRAVEIVGPGDVIGIDARSIVRVEPQPLSTNFEPNYLACIEFYDEDFCWRYTPAIPTNPTGTGAVARSRLVPWLTLLVVTDDEIERQDRPSSADTAPSVTFTQNAAFPPPDDGWAYAHVHANSDLGIAAAGTVLTDAATIGPAFDALIAANPDAGLSRLLSLRHLEENTGYTAFVIPTFESGRLAGLGEAIPAALVANQIAWQPLGGGARPLRYPVYHQWEFRTGPRGDFESLVRLLKPRPADARVGEREIDTRHAGLGVTAISSTPRPGIARLSGALRVPAEALSPDARLEREAFDEWDRTGTEAFQTTLAKVVNLDIDYRSGTASDPDPLITPPRYGAWHALIERVQPPVGAPANQRWVHELNLDPRHRVAAAFGTDVVQTNQETYMAIAWEQIGAVLEANRRIRYGQLGEAVMASVANRHLAPVATSEPGRYLSMTAPMHRRIVTATSGAAKTTVHHQLRNSALSSASVGAGMRRLTRPGGRLHVRLDLANTRRGALIERVARGDLVIAPPPARIDGPTLAQFAKKLGAADRTGVLRSVLGEAGFDIRALDMVRGRPNFALQPFTATDKGRDTNDKVGVDGERDSPVAKNYRTALIDHLELLLVSESIGRRRRFDAFDPKMTATATLEALDAHRTVRRAVLATLAFPDRFDDAASSFVEAMDYPIIDTPMYKPLVDRSKQWFVPNLELIGTDTITLLETNQAFIEAYMVGLNHELARELLWREYPTDQRGSSFRQFWDPRAAAPRTGELPAQRRERLRDIAPLDRWSIRPSRLGDHDHRQPPTGPAANEVVLVIRGELLKRYPTAVIYAQRAAWTPKADGNPDFTVPRVRAADTPDNILTPLYEAKVDPDVYFFGFALTAGVARGSRTAPIPDPGWFFVISERPGEPRFGLDLTAAATRRTWNDLAWPDVTRPDTQPFPNFALTIEPLTAPLASASPQLKAQHAEDKQVRWRPSMNAADAAYVLYQAPMLVAVHAEEMLGRG
jgi:hypothetical protein